MHKRFPSAAVAAPPAHATAAKAGAASTPAPPRRTHKPTKENDHAHTVPPPRQIPIWRRIVPTLPGAALAVLILAASAFQPQAQDQPPRRDTSGTVMDLSVWHDIKPHEFMLNIVDLPGATLIRAERRVRDKRIEHNRIWFDDRKGWIFVEHSPASLFGQQELGGCLRRGRRMDRPRGDAGAPDRSRCGEPLEGGGRSRRGGRGVTEGRDLRRQRSLHCKPGEQATIPPRPRRSRGRTSGTRSCCASTSSTMLDLVRGENRQRADSGVVRRRRGGAAQQMCSACALLLIVPIGGERGARGQLVKMLEWHGFVRCIATWYPRFSVQEAELRRTA